MFLWYQPFMVAVVFDMDGVIIDSEPVHKQIEDLVFADLGIVLSDEEYYHRFLGVNEYDKWFQVKRDWNLSHSVETLMQMERDRHAESYSPEEIPFVPGVLSLIDTLYSRGLPLAIASSSPFPSIAETVRRAGIEDKITAAVGGDQVSRSKPDPEIFVKAVEKLRQAASERVGTGARSEFVAIEDSPNGVTAARRAGLHVIGYQPRQSVLPPLTAAHQICRSMDEIAAVITALPTTF